MHQKINGWTCYMSQSNLMWNFSQPYVSYVISIKESNHILSSALRVHIITVTIISIMIAIKNIQPYFIFGSVPLVLRVRVTLLKSSHSSQKVIWGWGCYIEREKIKIKHLTIWLEDYIEKETKPTIWLEAETGKTALLSGCVESCPVVKSLTPVTLMIAKLIWALLSSLLSMSL